MERFDLTGRNSSGSEFVPRRGRSFGHVSSPTRLDLLDSNNKIKKTKCFMWCRLGTRNPFFLSLGCTEVVPNSQNTQ
jgi:hypothetical protein